MAGRAGGEWNGQSGRATRTSVSTLTSVAHVHTRTYVNSLETKYIAYIRTGYSPQGSCVGANQPPPVVDLADREPRSHGAPAIFTTSTS